MNFFLNIQWKYKKIIKIKSYFWKCYWKLKNPPCAAIFPSRKSRLFIRSPPWKIINHNFYWKFKKIRQARPFFTQGNRDFSSSRPHKKFVNHNFYWKFKKKMGKRDHFSFKEIAIFHQVAPIKNSLTIILCARSAENFWIHHWFCMNFLKKFFV